MGVSVAALWRTCAGACVCGCVRAFGLARERPREVEGAAAAVDTVIGSDAKHDRACQLIR
eukprot:6179472-Pleurochrysis_carterae.AAC.1